MPTFNEIQQEIAGMLSIPDEELTPRQREAMDAYMDELAKVEADKVDGFGQFLKIQSALADACKEEAKRLIAKAKAAEASLARLKEHYTTTLRTNGLKKVSGNAYTISVMESDAVAVTGRTEELPELYRRTKTTVEPEKGLIKEALKGGLTVPGCALVKTYSLQVR
jgi:hypothetical protein